MQILFTILAVAILQANGIPVETQNQILSYSEQINNTFTLERTTKSIALTSDRAEIRKKSVFNKSEFVCRFYPVINLTSSSNVDNTPTDDIWDNINDLKETYHIGRSYSGNPIMSPSSHPERTAKFRNLFGDKPEIVGNAGSEKLVSFSTINPYSTYLIFFEESPLNNGGMSAYKFMLDEDTVVGIKTYDMFTYIDIGICE